MIFIDKSGRSFDVRPFTPGDFPCLSLMYDMFTPKARFQGLPPFHKSVRDKWLRNLAEKGNNFLAWRASDVVGHVVILPDYGRNNAEYLIFVSQKARGLGVGKELTRTAIENAEDLGLDSLWLTVDAYNFRATRLYRKIGFKFLEEYSSSMERMMILTLGKK